MMRRFWIVGSFALCMGATGCTTTAQRVDRPLGSFAKAWDEAPVPPQRQVSLPPERVESVADSPKLVGLSKYFPGLKRGNVEAPKVASTSRTPWLSFARRSKLSPNVTSQTYTTDARAGLNRGIAEAPLPVALQIHSDRATDVAVTPTSAVGSPPDADRKDMAPPAPSVPAAEKIDVASLMAPSDPEVNPLPPAAEPNEDPLPPAAEPAVASRMPELPAIDPRERPRLDAASTVSLAPAAPPVEPKAAEPQTASPDERKSDDQAVKAVPSATNPVGPDSPEPTVQAMFLHKLASKIKGGKHVHHATVMASPQVAEAPKPSPQTAPKPTPQVAPKATPQVAPKPTPQAAPKPAVMPTSQAQASPQGTSAAEGCEDACTATHGKKTCLCRMIRKVFKVGESRHSHP